jgi:hypothetical protein
MWLLCAVFCCCSAALAAEFHVTPSGSSSGNGSFSRPWDLSTALSLTTRIRPGDIVWIHEGTYRGHFISSLSGTDAQPVTIRNYNSERVTLIEPDGVEDVLRMAGDYVWVWGLEIMSTGTTQTYFPAGINFQATRGCKAINCVIHDALGAGISNLNGAVRTEVYGCLLYYNGRSTGGLGNYNYGTYTQNVVSNGQKAMRENIIHYNWYMGIHAYSERSHVDNMLWEGNVVYNNGHFRRGDFERNFLLGGGTGITPFAVNDTIKDNFFYYSGSPTSGARATFGYYSGSAGLSLTGNYFIRGVFDLKSVSPTITGNTFYRNTYEGYSPSDFPNNTYVGLPNGETAYVRANHYEAGRANIIIFNWAGSGQVNADVSDILRSGDTYEMRDALNYFGSPVSSGTYDGNPISIPMSGLTCAPPQGTPAARPFHTGPEFGAFVLLRTGRAAGKPTGSLRSSQDTLPPGGGNVTLTWSSENATSARIEPGIGRIPVNGSTETRVVTTTGFKITLSNETDSTSCEQLVVVTELQAKGEQDVTANGTPVATVTAPCGMGNPNVEVIRDGVTPQPGTTDPLWQYDTFNPALSRSFEWVGYTFPTPYVFSHVVFQEGMEYGGGGFFLSPKIQVLDNGEWTDVENMQFEPPYQGSNGIGYESFDITFSPVRGNGIRIAGIPGGDTSFVSVAELRALALSETPAPVKDMLFPIGFELKQNFPNPFNPSTRIVYSLATASTVSLRVYDLLGQEVATLVDGYNEAGTHEVQFDAPTLSDGVYYCALRAGDLYDAKSMILLK